MLAAAAQSSGRPALICDHRTLSWQALNDQVQRLAEWVRQAVGTSKAIAVDLPDPMDLTVAFLAVARAGSRALVFDSSWTAAQRAAIDGQVQAGLTLDTRRLQEALAASPPAPRALTQPGPSDSFYVGFTSGSTGLPKGYRRTHQSWLASFTLSRELFGLSDQDVVMAPGSLATSLHLYGVIQALHDGIPVVLVPRFRPRSILQAMLQHGVTALYGTPTQITLLANSARRSNTPNLQLRHLIISGAKWPEHTRTEIRECWPKARLTEFYGTSEMSFIALHHDQDPAPTGSVGRPLPGVAVHIGQTIDQPLRTGTPGRIWVRSPLLFEDYECGGGDEIKADRGWLTVGDHGYLDDQGFLYLVGREKRMIVSSGLNLYPEVVEDRLLQHPGVRHAAVLAAPDALRGQKVVALIAPADQRASAEALRDHCAQVLPTAQVPRAWHFLEDWPLTASGKTDFVTLERVLSELEPPTGMPASQIQPTSEQS